MLGDLVGYDRLPYFYSDQYEIGTEDSGHAIGWDEVVIRGDLAAKEFIAFWLSGGAVQAGMNVNVWDVKDKVRALIRSRHRVDAGAPADVDTPLEALLPGVPAPG